MRPELTIGCRQTCGRAIKKIDRTGIYEIAHIFIAHPNGQIGITVAIEVARADGFAKLIVGAGDPRDTGAILCPKLAVRNRNACRRPIEDIDCPGVGDCLNILVMHTDRQVTESIAIKISGRQSFTEMILRFGATSDIRSRLAQKKTAC